MELESYNFNNNNNNTTITNNNNDTTIILKDMLNICCDLCNSQYKAVYSKTDSPKAVCSSPKPPTAAPTLPQCTPKNKLKTSPWDLICKIINCKTVFKKQCNGKKYNWIQLAGHAGRFKPGTREGYILKLTEENERHCLFNLKEDILRDYVPNIGNLIIDNDDCKVYTEMQDLLYGFSNPYIMDIKIGLRTFLEDEYSNEPRRDLYEKLLEMSTSFGNELTVEEHQSKAITKRRYMTWREQSTCSSTLGFRIEAIKKCHVSDKEFYTVRKLCDVKDHFKNYTDNNKVIQAKYLKRLYDIRDTLVKSDFFKSHEIIGSSFLFVHDQKLNVNIWIIDFGKTRKLPDNIHITHNDKWINGNHEDGYLIGVDSLIQIFEMIINDQN